MTWPAPAWAQYISQFFPSGVPGYQDETGVTVASRLRAPYEPQGVHVGDFLVHAGLGESLGYRSNVAGFAGAPGSWFAETAPSATIVSDWSRDQLGAAVTVDNTRYFSTPKQDTTDWTVAIGGGYTIGRENLTAGYSHLSLHELPNAIGSPLSQTPIPYTVDDARLSYAFDQGRFKFIPRVDVQLYQYGDATVLGVPISQSFDNRVVATAGVETHYALTDQHSLLFVARGTESRYTDTPAGQPTCNSQSILALGGIDYQADGPWRYRLLVGVERRGFDAAQYATHTAPIAEASVIWTPTGLTTVTGTLSRTIEDATQLGTAGYTLTQGSVVVDHEYLRNVLLQAKGSLQAADYLQGGTTQTSYSFGAGAQWLLNQHLRVALTYSFTQQTGSRPGPGVPLAAARGGYSYGNYNQNALLLTVRVAL